MFIWENPRYVLFWSSRDEEEVQQLNLTVNGFDTMYFPGVRTIVINFEIQIMTNHFRNLDVTIFNTIRDNDLLNRFGKFLKNMYVYW